MNFEIQFQRIQMKFFILLVLFIANVGFIAWIHSLFFPQAYQSKVIVGTFVFFLLFIIRDFLNSPQSYEVVELLGGSPLETSKMNLKHQQLLNVVEEMCLAAQVKIPFIYILKSEKSINAFFVGSSLSDCSLGFTQGALDQLSRDELQALTAHLLATLLPSSLRSSTDSFIQNDFLFHQKITSCVKAFVFVVNFAEKLIRWNDARSIRSLSLLSVLGVIVWFIGILGYFLARVLQVLLLRQKFRMADQVAVKLTRHPESLARVLLKIEKSQSYIRQMSHHEFSHFFFASTHSNWIDQVLPLHENFSDRIKRFYQESLSEVKLQENLFLQPLAVVPKNSLLKLQVAQNERLLKLAHIQRFMSKSAGMKLLNQISQDFFNSVMDPEKDLAILLAILYFEQGEFSQQKIRHMIQELGSQDLQLFDMLIENLKRDSFLRIIAFQIVTQRLQKQSQEVWFKNSKLVQELIEYDHQWTFVELVQFLILEDRSLGLLTQNQVVLKVNQINLIDLFKDTYIINLEQVQAELIGVKQSSFSRRKATISKLVFDLMQDPLFKNGFEQKQKDQLRWLSVYWQVTLPLLVWDSERVH